MSDTHSYVVLTTGADTHGRPDTRVDNVIAMAWDDDVLRLDGTDGPLLVVPLDKVVYVKKIEPLASTGPSMRRGSVTVDPTKFSGQIQAATLDPKFGLA